MLSYKIHVNLNIIYPVDKMAVSYFREVLKMGKKIDLTDAGFGTRMIHAGQDPDPAYGALATPIYQTSTFCFDTVEEGMQKFSG